MMRLLGKTLLVVTLICSGCATDRYKVDGRIIKVDGNYYRLNNTIGNAYILDPVYMDTVIVTK